jgi:hypothetical protein
MFYGFPAGPFFDCVGMTIKTKIPISLEKTLQENRNRKNG